MWRATGEKYRPIKSNAEPIDMAVPDPVVAAKQLVQFKALLGSDPFTGREKFDAVISAMCHRILSEQPAAGARLFMQMATDHRA